MPSLGQIEKRTQERVLALLSQRLGYTHWATGSIKRRPNQDASWNIE